MAGFDAIVVGAGPSGSLTALRLARAGARVLLIDGSHPREKPCGGGVTGRALALVADLGEGGSAFRSVRIASARFVDSARGRSARVALSADDLAVCSRTAFDGWLYRSATSAGVEVVPLRAIDIAPAVNGEVAVTTADRRRHVARWVVGADGATSLVRRRFGSQFSRHQLSIATGVFARGVSSRDIVVEMTSGPPGYLWSFPRPDHLAIGVCAQADCGVPIAALKTTVDHWLEATGMAAGADLEPYSWPIPSLPAGDFMSVPVSGPGWLTVGDAAGLVDPITREGIYFALQSAEYAARAIATGLDDAWRSYRDRVREEIGRELARAARYKAGFFRPAFARLLLSALESSGPVREIMADLVAGTQSYRDLKWRLLKTCEISLAWRVMTAPLYRDT